MYCKYCKKLDHIIDNCPDIVCKKCKQQGHTHWKCKQTGKVVKNVVKKRIPIVSKNINIVTNNNIFNVLEEEEDVHMIEYFLKFKDNNWCDL